MTLYVKLLTEFCKTLHELHYLRPMLYKFFIVYFVFLNRI
jgi:hypothetical protein